MENFGIEFPRSPEGAELNAMECCALRSAFVKNPDAVAQLEEIVSKQELRILADELKIKGIDRLTFPPDPMIKTVYFQMAVAELKRLEQEHANLHCGHSTEDHKKSLRAVESMFAEPVN